MPVQQRAKRFTTPDGLGSSGDEARAQRAASGGQKTAPAKVKVTVKIAEAKIAKVPKKMTQKEIGATQLIAARALAAKERQKRNASKAHTSSHFAVTRATFTGGSYAVNVVENEETRKSLLDEIFADLAFISAAGTMKEVNRAIADYNGKPFSMERDSAEQVILLGIADNYNNAVRAFRKSCP